MNREIKFRVWDGKEMHNVAGISWRDVTGYGEPERPARDKIQDIDFAEYEKGGWNAPYFFFNFNGIDEYERERAKAEIEVKEHEDAIGKMVLMQYTGLKDKNGKEIYEGDVITCYAVQRECYDEIEDGTKVTVSYYDGYFYPFGYNAGWRSEVGNIEIIGNIYENPELIKN